MLFRDRQKQKDTQADRNRLTQIKTDRYCQRQTKTVRDRQKIDRDRNRD